MFVCVALLALAVVPVINLSMLNGQKKEGQEWWSEVRYSTISTLH